MAERKILKDGFVGEGRVECDGKDHWMVREKHKDLNCDKETHVGPCDCHKLKPEGASLPG
jgi:hypothetical protein